MLTFFPMIVLFGCNCTAVFENKLVKAKNERLEQYSIHVLQFHQKTTLPVYLTV